MSPQSLKKFEKLAWIARLYFAANPFVVKIPREAFVVAAGEDKKDLVFHFPFQLVPVDAEPPRLHMIEDRNDENPGERMILEEDTAEQLVFRIPAIIKVHPPTFLGTTLNPWMLPGVSYVATENLRHFLEEIDGVTVTPDNKAQIFDLFGEVFERIAMLYELAEAAAEENIDGAVRAINRAAKDFQINLSVNRVGFSHLKFISALEDGSLLEEYTFFGLAPTALPERELAHNDLDRLSGQSSGLTQWEVVRDNPLGGKVEFNVITGWNNKFPVVMIPTDDVLPAWASQPVSGINSALFYPEGAYAINFTVEETHYFETLETAAKLSKRNPRDTVFPLSASNYVLAINLEEQGIESWLVSNENERVDKSYARLPWGEGFTATVESIAQRALWAARLSLYRARTKENAVIRPKEILKLGVAGSLSFMENEELKKLPQILKETLADNQPPKVVRPVAVELRQSVAV